MNKLKVVDLRRELYVRGLATTGLKPVLLRRLEEAICKGVHPLDSCNEDEKEVCADEHLPDTSMNKRRRSISTFYEKDSEDDQRYVTITLLSKSFKRFFSQKNSSEIVFEYQRVCIEIVDLYKDNDRYIVHTHEEGLFNTTQASIFARGGP